MSFLSPEQPPESFDEEQREWLARLFRQIDIELNKHEIVRRRTDFDEAPQIGKIYYFDNAPPSEPLITGEGLWLFKSTGWVQIG